MEYFRTKNHTGDVYRWCDSEMFQVIDTVTGEAKRISCHNSESVGTFEQAKKYIQNNKACEDRLIIVKLNCISANKLKAGE